MARGKRTEFDPRRIVAVRDLNAPNVLWVNFKDPTQPHPSVIEYAENLKRQKSMREHPSNMPKEDK